jgi:hypothetical protein
MIKRTTIILLSVFLIGCKQSIDKDYIKNHQWKYGSGDGWVGDFLFFDRDLYKISNDTILKLDTARAVIKSLDTNDFNGDKEMIIKLIKDGTTGTYHQK